MTKMIPFRLYSDVELCSSGVDLTIVVSQRVLATHALSRGKWGEEKNWVLKFHNYQRDNNTVGYHLPN